MTKEQRVEKVKDLLNQAVLLCGDNKDEFLVSVSDTIQDLLTEEDKTDSDDYYDSNCVDDYSSSDGYF